MRGRSPTLLLAAWLPFSLLQSCQRPNHPTFVSDGVVVNGPDDATRLQRALDRLGAVDLSTEGAAELTKLGGTALADRPGLLRELPAEVTARPLSLEGDTGALFLGSDEAALATALQAQGVKSLILQSRAAPSLDRGKTVLSRLYNHDSLERFTLFRIGDGLLYYKILDEPVSFPPNVAATSIAYLRHRLAGGPRASFPDVDSQIGHWTLIATLRGGGRELSVAYAQDGTLQGALEELVDDLETDHRRNVELDGLPPLNAHIADLDLELQRVVERAYVEPRDEKLLGDL